MNKPALLVFFLLLLAALVVASHVKQPAQAAIEPLSLAPLDQWIDTHNLPDNRTQVYYYFSYSYANCAGMVVQTGCNMDIGSYWATYKIYQSQTCKQFVLPAFPNAWSLYGYVNLFSSHNTYEGDDYSPKLHLVLPCLTHISDNNGRKYNLYPSFQPIVSWPYP